MPVPDIRIAAQNTADVRRDGDFVLYWMIAARRPGWNFALQRAVDMAVELERPLVVFEPLRSGYQWASDRLHAFILQGMADHAAHFASTPVCYYPYVEEAPDAGKGLLAALAARACMVVTDDFPSFFLRRMVRAAGGQVSVRLEAVDANGLLPLRASERDHPTAYTFRRFLQKTLRAHLAHVPLADPLREAPLRPLASLPSEILERWRAASAGLLRAEPASLAALPIDHAVAPVSEVRGGFQSGLAAVRRFLVERLDHYADDRNQPEQDTTSGLSPFLHFGHVSVHAVFDALMTREGWTSRRLAASTRGNREGWWGASRQAEAFLDELVTWRELGYATCHHRPDHDQYESLPGWARATLDIHASDPREHVYTLDAFEAAATHDPLWNAAQIQLRREGRIHNYLRMLWGKKILEWTASPRQALDVMVELNNKYALDGRNPNSWSGICWVLGRYDRPWAPERPIFGTVRYMSSQNTARKVRVRGYIRQYSNGQP